MMKIQLAYDRPGQAATDLLAVILDSETILHNLSGSPIDEMVRRIDRDFKGKRLKTDYFTSLDSRGPVRNLAVFSTALSPSYNVWENVKIFVARAIRLASDHGLTRVTLALNTDAAAPFIGKAVEGAVLGSYSFDRYKKEKSDLDKIQFNIVCLKPHEEKNRYYLSRYTLVSEAVNEARDVTNEPGSVVTPEYLAEAARGIATKADLDVKIWDERKLQKDGFNGLLQVGRGSSYPPRLIRLAYRTRKSKRHVAFVGKGITFDTGGISIKPADKMYEMKGDMAGGAAVLYAMKALGQLKPEVNVTGIVPTAGLYLAGEEKATHILDIATLTGACVRALGLSIAGVMGNNKPLIQAVVQSGQNQG